MARGSQEAAPLDDVMLAMDVVDTLRHRERIVQRELASEERRDELVARLKALYAAQGIAVPEHVIAEGVAALEQNRFAYAPPRPGFGTTLARVYVTRSRWGKPVLAVLGLAAVIAAAYQLMVVQPQARRLAALPTELATEYEDVVDDARVPDIEPQAAALLAEGRSALASGETKRSESALAELERLRERVEQQYELHIVSRPGELSGVWRTPDDNPGAQNYYLIVEALDPQGHRLTLPVRNEEDGRVYEVDHWGLRVDRATFARVEADKRDDGIIQNDLAGRKRPGYLEPEYLLSTTGGAITRW